MPDGSAQSTGLQQLTVLRRPNFAASKLREAIGAQEWRVAMAT